VGPAFFESAALVSRNADESDDEWQVPEYVSAKAPAPAPATTSLLETAANEEDGEGSDWQTPIYSDSAATPESAHRKEYAKVIVPPALIEADSAEAATVDSTATEAVQDTAETFQPQMVSSGAHGRVRFRDSKRFGYQPRRYRAGDRLYSRPMWNRFDPHTPILPDGARLAALHQYEKATHLSYDKLEAYCSTRLPESYGKYCRPVLRKFRRVSEGLRYGDRPEQICMSIGECPRKSYIRRLPHNRR